MGATGAYLTSRRRAAGFLAGAALAAAFARPSPPPRTIEALAAWLGRAAKASVAPDEVHWEPTRGALGDALLGRSVLFLAAAGGVGQRDVYRARVRVSPEGQPVEIEALRNLTETPVGD